MISPSGVNSNSYTPSHTAAQSCPTVGSDWEAATALPPTPNSDLCNCMYDALACVPSNQVSEDDIGTFFGLVCGLGNNVCAGIATNGTSGDYGAYGMCNSTQQLGWALDQYYLQQQASGNGASACDFSGSASTKAVVTPTGTCASLIQQAGSAGTGIVTSAPTGTGSSGGSGSGSGSGSSGSGSSSSGSSFGVAGLSTMPSLNLGVLQIGVYLVCAFGAGAGMILL